MSRFPRVGFNPLPWFFTGAGFDRTAAPPLADIYRQIREAGFDAVHAEVPAKMSVREYQRLLSDSELEPAPGYFQAAFSDSAATAGAVEDAKRVASQHAELGLDRIFLADQFGVPARVATPARGVDADASRLQTIANNLGKVASAMTAEGVGPCLHREAGQGRTYREAGAAHVWTEPGRGDVDFGAVLRALSGFDGWYVIEVDVADQPTPRECAVVSARWAREHLRTGARSLA